MQRVATLRILHIATDARFVEGQAITWEDSAADAQQRGSPPFLFVSPGIGSRRTARELAKTPAFSSQQRPAHGRFWLVTTGRLQPLTFNLNHNPKQIKSE